MDFACGRSGNPKEKVAKDGFVGTKDLKPKQARNY